MSANEVNQWYMDPRKVMLNFVLMSFLFSINHGTVVALIALASAELGQELSSVSLGVLYIVYTIVALTAAAAIVKITGSKWGLTSALFLYCAYVVSFFIASAQPALKGPAVIIGSVIGGFAAGWLWVAQGAYFGRSCTLYAEAKGIPVKDATGSFAGIFAFFYVGGELILRLLSSLLFKWGGNAFVYTVFAILAVSAAVLTGLFVRALPKVADAEPEPPVTCGSFTRKMAMGGELFVKSRTLKLLAPLQLVFGFCSAVLNIYVNGIIAKAAVGKANIGYLGTMIAVTATLLSPVYAILTKKSGKGPLMIFGALNFTMIAGVLLIIPEKQLEGLGWGIMFIYILQGSGRAVFEGTNKAVFAEFFPDNQEAAFANVIFQSGLSSSFAFFFFHYFSVVAQAIITVVTGVAAMIGLVLAFQTHAREQNGDGMEWAAAATSDKQALLNENTQQNTYPNTQQSSQ